MRITKRIVAALLISLVLGKADVIDSKINELKHNADIHFQLGNEAIVVQFYKQIIHLQEKHYGLNNVELAISTNKLGEILFSMGELEMARMHFDKSIQIYENLILDNQQFLLLSLENIKKIYKIEEHNDLAQQADSLINSLKVSNSEDLITRDKLDAWGKAKEFAGRVKDLIPNKTP